MQLVNGTFTDKLLDSAESDWQGAVTAFTMPGGDLGVAYHKDLSSRAISLNFIEAVVPKPATFRNGAESSGPRRERKVLLGEVALTRGRYWPPTPPRESSRQVPGHR